MGKSARSQGLAPGEGTALREWLADANKFLPQPAAATASMAYPYPPQQAAEGYGWDSGLSSSTAFPTVPRHSSLPVLAIPRHVTFQTPAEDGVGFDADSWSHEAMSHDDTSLGFEPAAIDPADLDNGFYNDRRPSPAPSLQSTLHATKPSGCPFGGYGQSQATFSSATPAKPQVVACECKQPLPIAFWRRDTHELIAFNEQFLRLVEWPLEALQRLGVRWDALLMPDTSAPSLPPTLRRSLEETKHTLYTINELVKTGGPLPTSAHRFCFVSGIGRIKFVEITVVGAENGQLLWVASSVACDSCASLQRQPGMQIQPQMSPPSTSPAGSEDEGVSEAAAEEQLPPAPPTNQHTSPAQAAKDQERQLVKVTARAGRRPWDQNLMKFSLKPVKSAGKPGSAVKRRRSASVPELKLRRADESTFG